jgi:hypothetical protein
MSWLAIITAALSILGPIIQWLLSRYAEKAANKLEQSRPLVTPEGFRDLREPGQELTPAEALAAMDALIAEIPRGWFVTLKDRMAYFFATRSRKDIAKRAAEIGRAARENRDVLPDARISKAEARDILEGEE